MALCKFKGVIKTNSTGQIRIGRPKFPCQKGCIVHIVKKRPSEQHLTVVLTVLWGHWRNNNYKLKQTCPIALGRYPAASTQPSSHGGCTGPVTVYVLKGLSSVIWQRLTVVGTQYGQSAGMTTEGKAGPSLTAVLCPAETWVEGPLCFIVLLYQHVELRNSCLHLRNADSLAFPRPLGNDNNKRFLAYPCAQHS